MQHITVECPFCYNRFIRSVLDYQGERKYKLNRDATCPHCQRVIVVNSKLLVIDPVPGQKPRREVVEANTELIVLEHMGRGEPLPFDFEDK